MYGKTNGLERESGTKHADYALPKAQSLHGILSGGLRFFILFSRR